jgi:hypothetical protein
VKVEDFECIFDNKIKEIEVFGAGWKMSREQKDSNRSHKHCPHHRFPAFLHLHTKVYKRRETRVQINCLMSAVVAIG